MTRDEVVEAVLQALRRHRVPMERLSYTHEEAAQVLGVDLQAVKDLIVTGKMLTSVAGTVPRSELERVAGPVERSAPAGYTVPEAAERLRLSPKTLWREIWAGRILVIRHGRKVLVPEEQIRRRLEPTRHPAAMVPVELVVASTRRVPRTPKRQPSSPGTRRRTGTRSTGSRKSR